MKSKIDLSRMCAALFFSLFMLPSAHSVELITNGGFETGDFTGWTVTDFAGGSGSWFVDSDALAAGPLSSIPTVGASSGNFYAVSDQTGPGTHILEQSFTLPGPASSVILRFDMFVNDSDGGPIINPAGLDHTAIPNQHSRVDLMTAGAGPFDTGAGVISNFYIGVDPQITNPNPYAPYMFDITGLVAAGGTYKIRFGEVDNQLFLNQGVDNVSIDFTPIPEPSTLAMATIAGLALSRRRFC